MKIEGEQAYPIYTILVKWSQDIIKKDRKLSDWQIEGLPEGRAWNSIRYIKMYKDEQDVAALQKKVESVIIPKFFESKNIMNPSEIKVIAEFTRYETWCLEWFCHWTFDNGRSNEEYLASFARFVTRMENLPENEYCLMGAEDRWRWKGTTNDGKGTTLPPCRCDHCKKAEVVRINH